MTWLVPLLYATWSSVFAFGKVVLVYSTPLFLTASRMILAGTILLIFLAFRNRKEFSLNARKFGLIALLALLCIFLTNILEFWGLQYLSSAKTCFIYSLSPFLSALFSYLHFKEKMTRQKWIGMGIGFLGILPVIAMQTGSENLFSAFSFFSWPTLAVMGAALFSVYGWVILRLMVKDNEFSPMMANGGSMLLGGIMSLIASLCIDTWQPVPIAAGGVGTVVLGTIGMTFLYNIFCYNLYGYLLKKYTATFLSFMGLLSPIFASLFGWLFLGEPIQWQIFFATGVISVGLWIVYRAELKQGYIKKTIPATNFSESQP